MKHFIYENDSVYEKLYTLEELKENHNRVYKKYMFDNYNQGEKTIIYEYEYENIYEYTTELTIEQLNKVVEHDFIYNTIEIFETLGKINKIV